MLEWIPRLSDMLVAGACNRRCCSCGAERREWTATAGPIFERALAHEAAFAAKLENWPVERRTREMFREHVSIGSPSSGRVAL